MEPTDEGAFLAKPLGGATEHILERSSRLLMVA